MTSAGVVLYGQILWNPLTLIGHWDNRAAAFFASFTFALATLGTNVSANTLSAANDMTVLFPRYVNIKRGQVIIAVVAPWAFVPWEIVSSAQGFLSFMNGYTVFLGPFAGIMVTDVSVMNSSTSVSLTATTVLGCPPLQGGRTGYVSASWPVSVHVWSCESADIFPRVSAFMHAHCGATELESGGHDATRRRS